MNKVVWAKPFTWLIIFAVLAFSGCFSPWKEDKATIILFLNGDSPGRAAVFPPDDAVFSRLEHTVELSNPSENITFQAKGGKTIKAVVTPGAWDISVQSFLDGEPYATGSATANLQPGQDNIITLTMYRAFTKVTIAEGIQNGSITASPESGHEGTRITVTIQADPGYRLKAGSLAITPEVTLSGTGNTRTFTLPGADVTISGEFEEIPIHTVTVAEGIENGSITAGPESGYEGITITVTIQADDGYRLKSLTIEPEVTLNGSGDSRTFTLPGADVTISCEFEAIPVYAVTVAEGIENGSITASPESGYEGTRITVTIQADPGYRLKAGSLQITPAVTISGSGNTRTFTLPDADVTISGEFEEISSGSINIEFNEIGAEIINLTSNIENDIFWNQTLVVTIIGEYDSYQWYLDGYQQSWDTPTAEINIYGGYEIRIHSLMAVVTKDGTPHSKELIFRVKYREGP